MNNNDLNELKPIYIQQTSPTSPDDISLTDLVVILYRRKAMILSIVFTITVFAFVATFMLSSKYSYSTSIEIGSQLLEDKTKRFESPETLLAKIQYSFIPQTLSEHFESNKEDKKKYKIEASVPKDSVIIIINTEGTEDEARTLNNLLRGVTQKAVLDHKKIYDAVKENLMAQKARTESELATLDSKTENKDEKERYLKSMITVIESKLTNLKSTREILPPLRSTEPTSTSKILLVIAAIFISIFIAIFTAYIAEFISRVKERDAATS